MIDKQKLIALLKQLEMFNTPIPKWVWKVIEDFREEKDV